MGSRKKKKKQQKKFVPFDYTEQKGDGEDEYQVQDTVEYVVAGEESANQSAAESTALSADSYTTAPEETPSGRSYATVHEERPQFSERIERILERLSGNQHDTAAATAATPRAQLASTDKEIVETGTQAQAHPLRNMAMNQYGTQPSLRQTPRLQNTQKTGLGNGNAGAGWAFGNPASGNAFGGLSGGAPGLVQGRPQQLSGFAQVMGGGSGQGPIDMRYVS